MRSPARMPAPGAGRSDAASRAAAVRAPAARERGRTANAAGFENAPHPAPRRVSAPRSFESDPPGVRGRAPPVRPAFPSDLAPARTGPVDPFPDARAARPKALAARRFDPVAAFASAEGRSGVIQGKFTMLKKKVYDSSEQFDPILIRKIKSNMNTRQKKQPNPIISEIKAMAEDDATIGNYSTWKQVVQAAASRIEARAILASGMETIAIPEARDFDFRVAKRKRDDDESPDAERKEPAKYNRSKIGSDKKIERMNTFKRSASLVSDSDPAMKAFRTRTVGSGLTHRSTGTYYWIKPVSNFQIGGKDSGDGTYRDLFALMKARTGWSDQRMAQFLIAALTHRSAGTAGLGADATGASGTSPGGGAAANPVGEGARVDAVADLYAGLTEPARNVAVKLVALFEGAERRRAAYNPVAAIMALNQVGPDSDIYDVLERNAVFVRAEGGSRESQYHRENSSIYVDFRERAAAEHDALADFAMDQGVDPDDDDAMDRLVRQVTASSDRAFADAFVIKPGHEG